MRKFLTSLVVAATVLVAAAPSMAEDAPETIRFGDVGFGFGTPFGVGLLAVADAKGFIADEFKGTPTKVEFTYFTGTGPAINEALSNGQLDFAAYGAVPNIIGKANGLDTVIVASYGGTTIFGAARPDVEIKTVADLKGKRVAIQKATIIHWGLIQALKNAGLTEADVQHPVMPELPCLRVASEVHHVQFRCLGSAQAPAIHDFEQGRVTVGGKRAFAFGAHRAVDLFVGVVEEAL